MKKLIISNMIAMRVLFVLTLPGTAQAQFNFTTNNGAITITGYTGTSSIVVIPSTTNGFPVTSIASSVPDFSSILGFYSSVANVTIPDSVTNIAFGAFELFDIEGAPPPATFLSAITVDTNNPIYGSMDGVLIDKINGTLIQYPWGKAGCNYTIPDCITNIANDAFYYCTNLGNVTISGNVTNIGNQAFDFCSSLTNATIGNNVTSIGANAFKDTSLTSVIIGANVINIGADAFEYTSLTNVTIPNSVINIGSAAFGYTSLTSVIIGTNVINIGDNAFQFTGLADVTIPNSVTSIGSQAFFNCTSLTSITIGDNVTNVGTGVFDTCSSLTNITFPASVTSIGNDVFDTCRSLTEVYFMGNAPSVGFDSSTVQASTVVYYLPGTTGWGTNFDGLPAALWLPQMQPNDAGSDVQTNQFGFNINWANGQTVVVEACTNLSNPVWFPLKTNTLTGGSFYFGDPQWTNYPGRFYRLGSQ